MVAAPGALKASPPKAYNSRFAFPLRFPLSRVHRMNKVARRQVALWLFICSAMVFAILVVGGVTRLTHSGCRSSNGSRSSASSRRSIRPNGTRPSRNTRRRRNTSKVNHQMTLDEFKGIFFWEYWHRFSGG
jgi:cytochrome c oxidase assembly protein subunit 15